MSTTLLPPDYTLVIFWTYKKQNKSSKEKKMSEIRKIATIGYRQFWSIHQLVWFSIMEAQINITKITQTNPKFYYTFPWVIVGKLQIIILQQTDYDMLKDACEKFKLELWDKLMSSSVVTGPSLIYLNELIFLVRLVFNVWTLLLYIFLLTMVNLYLVIVKH